MSSTKILIIVLILIALLFVVFVVKGGLSKDQPKSGNRSDAAQFSRGKTGHGWTKPINSLFDSLKPKVQLHKTSYVDGDAEQIQPDKKKELFRTVTIQQTFRTVTFHSVMGLPVVNYKDNTKNVPEGLEDLKDQTCEFPNNEGDDPTRCSIVALKQGGVLTFSCKDPKPCKVNVE